MVFVRLAGNEKVLVVGESISSERANKMNEAKAMKVFDLLAKENLTHEDYEFLTNNLAPFSSVLIEAGAHAMTEAGMEREEALSILETLAMVSRMAGAGNFVDFVNTKNIMEG
jgi:hypothetical protein